MAKSLVIVESPAKAKTINKYLGNDFVVKSSVGHIRDLPTGAGSKKPVDTKARAAEAAKTRKMAPEAKAAYKKEKAHKQLIEKMGVDPEKDWSAKYQVLPGKEKVVDELKKLAKSADHIYLATDLDREGEAIAWHLREVIGGEEDRFSRVTFNEITKTAIKEAFEHPDELNMARVNAQQARRFLDRVVGFMVSPLLWSKITRGLSAGRVQSVAVRLVVDREREIRAFNPEEYWEAFSFLNHAADSNIKFQVAKHNGENFRPVNKTQAQAAVAKLETAAYSVTKREDKPTKSKPGAPFITSTLQQAASTRLGFGVKKTMMLAQRLYEAGYITYMRTDSTALSKDAVEACRGFIDDNFGDKYLPENPNVYSSKEGAQEAHEAIRPSDVNRSGASLSDMERDAQRLYELIWRQFVACQMVPAEYTSTTITVTAGEFELRTRGRVVRFDGYTRVMPQIAKKEDDITLPDLQQGDQLDLNNVEAKQHFTKPPARFSEAALVKELEKRGIGRPSTYASIISTIQDRGYVRLENKRFYAEKMGEIVTDRLLESFNNLMDYGFTAGMEEQLDDVAEGSKEWKALLNEFYGDFKTKLDHAESDEGMRPNTPTETNIMCPDCGRNMLIRNATTGVFLACSGYALKKDEQCKKTLNLAPGEDAVAVVEGSTESEQDEAETLALRQKERCPICDNAMESYLIDESRKLHICGNNPACSGYKLEAGTFKIKGYDGPVIECDKCGSEMQLKTGRFGKYFGCTNEECKNTRKLLKNGEPAPPKMDPVPMPELKCQKVDDHYILRDGATGMFLAASQFPKNRETRAPKVVELLPHKAEIDPKYHFLLEGEARDENGNEAQIRFSRKTKQQYLMTENAEGKATGWTGFYDQDTKKWTYTESKKPAKKKAAPKKK
ncbi:type I DNA topoisomerase [Litoribrevibacter albus]|uniref:DNA topoisomerase 1 n=1 Tax=Litoribrevibacter albus TaxID=1473156 RepID=A0AA37SA68_9GAMM|nr:type I DNA topoisomerase [Litoribrevibacter albus]GLQ31024.1 DNA topoisomerase 1 [Litoribrevibacter albus]